MFFPEPAPAHEAIFIRRATAGDAPGILACLAAAFAPYRNAYTPDAWLDTVLTATSIDRRLSSMNVLVAVSPQEGVVGTIASAVSGEHEGHLRGMAVLPAWLGKGIAEELLQAAEDDLVAQKCARVTLDTTEPLERATRFYEKHGYRRTGLVSDFFGMRLHEYEKCPGTGD